MASEIPVSVIVLLLEHIAISKSFGRLNNYKINPNQELIAIGVTNLIGPAFGGYAATGSFVSTLVSLGCLERSLNAILLIDPSTDNTVLCSSPIVSICY